VPLPPPQAGCAEIVGRVVDDLKDESEPYRRMVMETVDKVVAALGAADIDARLEEQLVDGILYAFQEQARGALGFGCVREGGQDGRFASTLVRQRGG
jgi:hypothetical protein